jgi:hypothetical protein
MVTKLGGNDAEANFCSFEATHAGKARIGSLTASPHPRAVLRCGRIEIRSSRCALGRLPPLSAPAWGRPG